MEHQEITLENDKTLIEKVLDDRDMRYIVLFMYIVRNDLLKDFIDQDLLDAYEKVLILDDIYKSNVTSFWDDNLIEVAIDLGLFKNIRTMREFEAQEDDFIIKMGEETVTIEDNTMLIPDDVLFLMIRKKFKFLTRRNFNSALTRLKGVRCEIANLIHPFIFEIGENDYTIADDLYYVLEQFGNIYQAIKIEITIEGFHSRFKEIDEKIKKYIQIYDSLLNTKPVMKKINHAIKENMDILTYLREEKVELPEKFTSDTIKKDDPVYIQWNSTLLTLLNCRFTLNDVEQKILEIKDMYSGKKKKLSYLDFIEKVSFNEDGILDSIQQTLLELRQTLVRINKDTSEITEKKLKLLNLDLERMILLEGEDEE